MAKKAKTVYICSECGNEYPSWQGQCSYCGAWNTIKEHRISELKEAAADSRLRTGSTALNSRPVKLSEVGASSNQKRIQTGIGELDRVLGSGIVPGSLVLISGEPGIGKSTVIAQAANEIARAHGSILYVSGEESEEQVRLRADRVCNPGISEDFYIFSNTNIESVIATCEEMKPHFVVIDSIQTMYSQEIEGGAGSISQIRACSNLLIKYAKSAGVPIFIVAHVTKSGELAGPKTIEHMVDCVLSFAGERDRDLRILRAFKNRFGTTDEIGAFRMTSEGMSEVSDLSGSLIETRAPEEGSVISAVYEGSRPVFFEIQALVAQANVGFARRTAVGINHNRLNMILAVLEKKAGISLINHDVYVNVVGGMNTGSTSTDLAVALAIYSSYSGTVPKTRLVAIGEVGLTGHLRSVPNTARILQEARRLGYTTVLAPQPAETPPASHSQPAGFASHPQAATSQQPVAAQPPATRVTNLTDAIHAFTQH